VFDTVEHAGGGVDEPAVPGSHEVGEQGFLAGDVVVDAGVGEVDGSGEVSDAGRGVALTGEEQHRRGLDPQPGVGVPVGEEEVQEDLPNVRLRLVNRTIT
jgi:hypothetical protein